MSFNRLHIFALPVLVSLLAVACEEPSYINGPGENLFNQDSIIPVVEPAADACARGFCDS